MIIGIKKQLAKVNIDGLSVGESIIAPVTSVRNLGSWFDQNLSVPHINKICKAASFHIYNTKTTTWNLLGPSGTRDCIDIIYLSHRPPSSVEANT